MPLCQRTDPSNPMTDSLPATLGLILLLGLPASLWGQNVSLDEGAFRLSVNGTFVGREEFSIRRTGLGDQARVVLRGTIEREGPSGPQEISTVMAAEGSGLETQEYQVRVTGSVPTEIYAVRSGARYMARVLSSEGEQVREFRAGPGSVLLDEEVAHHHFLLAPFLDQASSVSLTVLTPRAGRQSRMTLSLVGEEEVRVGGSLFPARHFRLDGETDSREIWLDGQGRVLQVLVPGTGLLAERESLS